MDNKLGDWRKQAVTQLAQDLPANYPGGPSHKAGSLVQLVTSTTGLDNQSIGFVTPSATALALNIAINSSIESVNLYKNISFDKVITPEGLGRSVSENNITTLFNYFEQCMITVTFSFQALEAFSNRNISDKVQGTFPIKLKDVEEHLTASDLERRLSTEEKLHKVLPKLFQMGSPKGKKVWQDFITLKRARDAIVHLKSSDQYPNRNNTGAVDKVNQDSLFFVFLNNNMSIFPKSATEMVKYFYSNTKDLPRWLEKSLEFTKTN